MDEPFDIAYGCEYGCPGPFDYQGVLLHILRCPRHPLPLGDTRREVVQKLRAERLRLKEEAASTIGERELDNSDTLGVD